MPGEDDPVIFIRGQSTWNNAQPLILVDGIERTMNDIDINEVESVSVLKDASATAVFGVKGAEGVILITTKRGRKGTPKLEVGYNSSIKTISRLPEKMNSYDALSYRNRAIEYELPVTDQGWGKYVPQDQLMRYQQPQAPGDQYIFPDVDWKEAFVRDFGISHRANISISGGSDFARYFGSLSYLYDGDILDGTQARNRPYSPGYSYDRINYRTNLDLDVTASTLLSVNISGFFGMQKSTHAEDHRTWEALYKTAPFAFPVKHEYDPEWGYTTWGYTPEVLTLKNPVLNLSNTGVSNNNRNQIMTDFELTQKLDFIVSGLSMSGSISYDNRYRTSGGITEGSGRYDSQLKKYIDPNIVTKDPEEPDENYITYQPATGDNDFDFQLGPVFYNSEGFNGGSNYRRIFYQMQLNYSQSFDKHDVTALALLNREQFATGSMFPRYREDWVGRITYNYDDRYFFESNGAYNGSEKFGEGYRFGFFPSVAAGWLISNEDFMEGVNWLDHLKIRYSVGKVGNDNFNAPRWAYETQWVNDDRYDPTHFGYSFTPSPYPQYVEGISGNPFLHWETAVKQNIGVEFWTFDSRIRLNYWGNISYTHAKDEVIYMEDPQFALDYRKREGFQIGQTKTIMHDGFENTWDDIYSSAGRESSSRERLPGELHIIDFNGDGVISGLDNAPYGYPQNRPQNTYNLAFGADFRGFSVMAQFYGVYNVTTPMALWPFRDELQGVVFEENRDHWTPDNTDAAWRAPRWWSDSYGSTLMLYDGSYLRLKTAEIAYTISGENLNLPVSFTSIKLFANGHNLAMWSDLPDDRESPARNYPMFRRYNFGFKVNL